MLRICALFVLLLAPGVAASDPVGTIRVIDGDTWDVGDTRVRLFGIDAMEREQTCIRPNQSSWPCGTWTTKQVRARFEGRQASCRAVTIDRYDRVVARCWVGGQDAGRALVQSGLALAYRKYSMDYDLDEKRAHVAGVGIHQSVVQRPSEFRANPAVQPAPEGCAIKGNISSKGARIYHMPGQVDYGRTRISAAKGERWFCSEQAARAAGWRRAKR